jgi:hypothetical protein
VLVKGGRKRREGGIGERRKTEGWICVSKGEGTKEKRTEGEGEGGREEAGRTLGRVRREGWRTVGPCTCVDIHSKGVLLAGHQAVSVILGHDASDVVFQLWVEVKVCGSNIGNDSAWLSRLQHTHCLDGVEELRPGVIDVINQDGDKSCAREGHSAPVSGYHCQPVGLLFFPVNGGIAHTDDPGDRMDEETVLSPGFYSVDQLPIEATVLICGRDLKD